MEYKPSDLRYKSSESDMESFINSSVWKDLKAEISMWIEDIRDTLENKEKTPDFATLKELQGSAEALRKVLEMPDVVLDNIREDIEDERRKNEERS